MKKWQIALLILLAPFIFVMRFYPLYDSMVYHNESEKIEELVEQTPEMFQALLNIQGEEIRDIAETIVTMREEDSIIIYYTCPTKHFTASYPPSKKHLLPPSKKHLLEEKIRSFRRVLENFDTQIEMPLYSVFSPRGEVFYYPKESCVFRYQLMVDDDVRYHVDLIYSPYWEEHKQKKLIHDPFGNDLSIEIAENWYAVILRTQ